MGVRQGIHQSTDHRWRQCSQSEQQAICPGSTADVRHFQVEAHHDSMTGVPTSTRTSTRTSCSGRSGGCCSTTEKSRTRALLQPAVCSSATSSTATPAGPGYCIVHTDKVWMDGQPRSWQHVQVITRTCLKDCISFSHRHRNRGLLRSVHTRMSP